MTEQIDVLALAARLGGDNAPCVLDVREPWEQQLVELQDSLNIPMARVPESLDELKQSVGAGDLVVMCHHGSRSEVIVRFLMQQGFERVLNLTGGIHAWAEQIDQKLTTY